jgi:hypothetical protein
MGGPKGISANLIQIFDTITDRLLSATGFYSLTDVHSPATANRTAQLPLERTGYGIPYPDIFARHRRAASPSRIRWWGFARSVVETGDGALRPR